MAANFLIDTGAILALLDKTDRWNRPCITAFQKLRLPALTSEAVLAEVFHLAHRSRTQMETVWKFVRSGVIQLATIEDSELNQIQALMIRYRDTPMDFADATLVFLAERESLSVVLTVDQSEFHTYRIGSKSRFHVLPEQQRR